MKQNLMLKLAKISFGNLKIRKSFSSQGFSTGFSRSWLKLALKLVLASCWKSFSTQGFRTGFSRSWLKLALKLVLACRKRFSI